MSLENRKWEILKEYLNGMSIRQLAKKHQATTIQISNIISRAIRELGVNIKNLYELTPDKVKELKDKLKQVH